ncbi:MAG: site-specific DNA-methyltransferase [Clostridia bacterium]|nr:site-specific DNA-methyltransferase [Clostridia bacterium]
MLHTVKCIGERHMLGGDGLVISADILKVQGELAEPFFGRASVVYIDPPAPGEPTGAFRRGAFRAEGQVLSFDECADLMKRAVSLAYSLLSENGTVFLHTDTQLGPACRAALDGTFGAEAFVNEIIWVYRTGGRSVNSFSKKHDTVYMYRKSPDAYFNIGAVGTPRGAKRRNHMKRGVGPDGRVYYSTRMRGREYRYYEDEPVYPSDVWTDIDPVDARDGERSGYREQRPEALLRRIILASAPEGSLAVGLFDGSGACAHAAAALGRSFISLDNSPAALAVTRNRLVRRALRLPLYEQLSPFEVRFASPQGEDAPDISPLFDVSENGGRLSLSLKPRAQGVYYAAVGSVEDGVFCPVDYLRLARAGDRAVLKPGECLHLVLSDFTQGFYVYGAGQTQQG